MKRMIVMSAMIAIIGMFSISVLAAEGAQERWDERQNSYYNSERLSVEGTARLTASGVELQASDGKEYELMYPRYLAEDVQVRDGQTVSVEGYLVPGPRWDWGKDENHLRVDKVTIGGKEYDLAASFGPREGTWGPGACWGNSGYDPGTRNPRGGGYGNRGPGMMGRW